MSIEWRNRTAAAALGLLAASLAALLLGRFIQFEDTSGFGSDRWVLPLGPVAALLAASSILVAIQERAARRVLGVALALLDLFLIVQAVANDGFRFIWSAGDGELFHLQVALGLAALFLLTPRFYVASARGRAGAGREVTAWARVSIYSTLLVVITFAAFSGGVAQYESANCSAPDFDGECDVAGLAGMAWAAVAFVLVVGAVAVIEGTRARRKRLRRAADAAAELLA